MGMRMDKQFNGCVVHVYNPDGSTVAQVKVLSHDALTDTIDVTQALDLVDNTLYNLLILTSTSPYAVTGVIEQRLEQTLIKLAKGEMREQRADIRYSLTGEAESV